MKKQKIKIAFFDTKPYDLEFFNELNKRYHFIITFFDERLNTQTASLTKGFNVVCAFVNDALSKEVVKILYKNKIKLIALRAAGYNNVDLKAVYGKIHVVRVPAYSPHAVAEHAVALMLALNRKIHKAYFRTREGNFSIQGLLGFDMFGKTVGIIGTGQIGKVAIEILKGFGMNILAYDPYPDPKYAAKAGFSYTDLNTLFKKSDVISLHCPLTRETYHMINDHAIMQMKPGVMLINTGRGGLIDSKALIKGLKTGMVGAAGLDVYEEESEYFFEDFSGAVMTDDVLARLLSFSNVLITSHQGFFTREALHNIAETTLSNIKAYFSEGKLQNEVCYKCGKSVCQKKTKGFCFKTKAE